MELVTQLFEHYRQAEQKFDYFIAGLTVTLLAFLAKDYTPASFEYPEQVEALSLMLLLLSTFCSIKRLQSTVASGLLNYRLVAAKEDKEEVVGAISTSRGAVHLSIENTECVISSERAMAFLEGMGLHCDNLRMAADSVGTRAGLYYRLRNLFLYAGISTLVLARVMDAMQP